MQNVTTTELIARDARIGRMLDEAPNWDMKEARELLAARRAIRAELERRKSVVTH
jgi:hypothetical protein